MSLFKSSKKFLLYMLRKVVSYFDRLFVSNILYWEKRASRYGVRSALNIGHTDNELESVLALQEEAIFPHLKHSLNGDENTILDFGCGPGRFTKQLADMIDGNAVGVDPIETLLKLAPNAPNVKYLKMEEGHIPLDDSSIDLVWVCLVLGGITDGKTLLRSVCEIRRVLKNGGLLFMVENTTKKKSVLRWVFRSVEEYKQLFPFANLKLLATYHDLDEEISIMSGRVS